MGKLVRSARGELIDFELLAIKQQLAAAPVPKAVEVRKQAIDLKDGVRADDAPGVEPAVTVDVPESGRAKQLKQK